MKNRRMFFHYMELEETSAGFWRFLSGNELKDYVAASTELLQSPSEFYEAVKAALIAWPNSTEAALTSENGNQIAFLGQAACCVASGSPEGATRIAWHSLTISERAEANRMAEMALSEWRVSYNQASDQADMFRA